MKYPEPVVLLGQQNEGFHRNGLFHRSVKTPQTVKARYRAAVWRAGAVYLDTGRRMVQTALTTVVGGCANVPARSDIQPGRGEERPV